MRAIFTTFDNFIAMFIATVGVLTSSMFMPLLGGPLQPYEAQAIGAGWQSLREGQALSDALDAATSFPVEAVFPSAQAADIPLRLVEIEPEPLELLGGPNPTQAAPLVRTRRPRLPLLDAPVVSVEIEPLPDHEPVLEMSG